MNGEGKERLGTDNRPQNRPEGEGKESSSKIEETNFDAAEPGNG